MKLSIRLRSFAILTAGGLFLLSSLVSSWRFSSACKRFNKNANLFCRLPRSCETHESSWRDLKLENKFMWDIFAKPVPSPRRHLPFALNTYSRLFVFGKISGSVVFRSEAIRFRHEIHHNKCACMECSVNCDNDARQCIPKWTAKAEVKKLTYPPFQPYGDRLHAKNSRRADKKAAASIFTRNQSALVGQMELSALWRTRMIVSESLLRNSLEKTWVWVSLEVFENTRS